jgi:hypothetical protein
MENKEILSSINNDILLRYIHGTASEAEKALIDSTMKEDEFLQDAIEGLKLSSNPLLITNAVATINNSICVKSGYIIPKSGAGIKLPALSTKAIMSIASSIVIIAGTYLLANTLIKNKSKIAQNKIEAEAPKEENKEIILSNEVVTITKDEAPTISPTTTNSELNVNNNPIGTLNNTDEKSIESNGTASDAISTNQNSTYTWTLPTAVNKNNETANRKTIKGQIVDSKTKTPISGVNVIAGNTTTLSSQNGYYEIAVDDANTEIEFSKPNYKDQAKKINASNVKTVNVELNQGFITDVVASEENNKLETVKEKAVSDPVEFKQGLDEYSNQEYDKAIKSFDKVLQKNPNNLEANYYNGLANVSANKNTKALGYFNKVIKSNNKYTDDAKWQKAQILLQQNNNTEAKAVLEDLKKSAKYKEQAEKLLLNQK